ncbi:hypothetical protein SOPP22_16595 [Shewanella sp. OPT22]|nr:hypothetical protein SOPP22_16595 [Shewanella sp. OPT22]
MFVLFLVYQGTNGEVWEQEKTFALYAEFTMFVYIGILIGGLLADLITGSFYATLLGGVFTAIGFISIGYVDSDMIQGISILIALGTGLMRPNILSLITLQLQKFPNKLKSIFIAQYLVINLSAAIGAMLAGLLITDNIYSNSFILAACCSALCCLIITLLRKKMSDEAFIANRKTNSSEQGIYKGVLLTFGVAALSLLFWSLWEAADVIISEKDNIDMTLNGIVNSLTVLASSIILLIVFWCYKIKSMTILSMGLLMFSLGWFLIDYSITNDWQVSKTIIVMMALHSIAEVICSAVFLSIIATKSDKRVLSTSFAVFLIASYFSGFFANLLVDTEVKLITFGIVSGLVVFGLMSIPKLQQKFA